MSRCAHNQGGCLAHIFQGREIHWAAIRRFPSAIYRYRGFTDLSRPASLIHRLANFCQAFGGKLRLWAPLLRWGSGIDQSKFSGVSSRSLYVRTLVAGSGGLVVGRSSEAALAQCGAKVLPFGLDLLQTYIFTMYGQASCGIAAQKRP